MLKLFLNTNQSILHFEIHVPVHIVKSKLFKKYSKILNRLCDITWFGAVYA
jgi:hypothetical protein